LVPFNFLFSELNLLKVEKLFQMIFNCFSFIFRDTSNTLIPTYQTLLTHEPNPHICNSIGKGYFDSNAFYDPDYYYNQDVVRNAARMRQNQKQTQQLPQNPQQQQMQMQQQQKMMGGPNGPKPMDNKTMGNMQQMQQNLPGQQNKQNQMVITNFAITQLFLEIIAAKLMFP
jgi:hypothetical protein